MSDCPLVFVEWEDSAQPIPGWQHLSNFEAKAAIKCVSVGWLIYDGGDTKAIAPNMGDIDGGCSAQASGIIRIPTRCITRIVKLEEPEITSRVSPCSHPETGQTPLKTSVPA